ncbi:MAG: cell wall metabolism sensor histidine kinase WalK [Oscillospiraceae bacterium]|nr:cell wall metabolism sensor histidine kinase WalK [Oscillospiraceae bacterium]
MFRSIYARLLALFLAVLLVAMALLSVLLYQRVRQDKIDARLNELTIHAREIAYLISARTYVDFGLNQYIVQKAADTMQEYDANLVLFDRYGQMQPLENTTIELTSEYTVEITATMLERVYAGEEVRLRSTIHETGTPVYSVGVPYVVSGWVQGAVFIHSSAQNVESSYREILREGAMVMLLSLLIAAVLVLVACRFITRPLQAMAAAADRFARGDFEQRVLVTSRDEVGRLAESFNSMAADLDRLESTRREFVANVSHELRSPLTSMQGFIGGILDGTVPEDQEKHYLGIVQDETRRLSKLITELLDLSRMESGQTTLNKTSYDLNEQIARVLLRQEGRINARGMQVELAFASDACPVRADADRIEQVLINLIDNAIKYGKEGGQITVSTRREKNLVHVAIADDGAGIAEADLPCVFDRFYKADKAHTSGQGTGLGLSIVKKILEQHGQTIAVKSHAGEGTRFEFTLDCA